MRQILIELHTPGKEEGDLFILEHPSPNEDNFYPQAVSYTWFHDRQLKNAFPEVSSGQLINGMNWMEYAKTVKYCSEHQVSPRETISEFLENFGVDINTVSVCKGVWDFYDKIGYDRKKKKYV